VLIEWAERAAALMPADHLAIQIRHLSETKRVFRFEPHGLRYTELVDQIKGAAFA
jgi:tRNA threonylcarbamoyladenosine biosynthesis protein TsaE